MRPLSLLDTSQSPATSTPLPRPGRHAGPVVTALALVAAFLALSLLYTRVARSVPVNSDTASIVLEASAVLHGNPGLRGWTLSNESFYTLDLPFHLVAVACHGVSLRVMREAPAAVYALTVLGAVWLAGRGPDRRSPRLGRAVTFALIGLPSMALPSVLLMGVQHVATTLAMVGALAVLDVSVERVTKARWLGLGFLCILLVVNDPMAVTLFVAPTIIVALVRHARRASAPSVTGQDTSELRLAAVATGGLLLGDVFLKAVHAAGGFQTTPLTLRLVPLSGLSTNGFLLLQGLLSLFRADVFGELLNVATLGRSLDLLALGMALWAMTRTLRGWADWRRGDRVAQILSVAMIVNLAAILFDGAVFDLYRTLTSPVERYLIPFFVFGAILAGRCGVEQIGHAAGRRLSVTALGVVAAAGFAVQLQEPAADARAGDLARRLAARGLRDGYGNYWCSSVVSVASGGAVRVRPVDLQQGRLAPKRWFSDERWYEAAPARFLVFDIAQVGRRCFFFDDVNLQTATRTFGPPTEIDRTDGYTILIWDKDITPDLERGQNPAKTRTP